MDDLFVFENEDEIEAELEEQRRLEAEQGRGAAENPSVKQPESPVTPTFDRPKPTDGPTITEEEIRIASPTPPPSTQPTAKTPGTITSDTTEELATKPPPPSTQPTAKTPGTITSDTPEEVEHTVQPTPTPESKTPDVEAPKAPVEAPETTEATIDPNSKPKSPSNLSMTDQYFQILGENTNDVLTGKMSNKEGTEKTTSKTYLNLNEKEGTSRAEMLENRLKTLERGENDYKEGKSHEKIKARQDASKVATKKFHEEVLSKAEGAKEPIKTADKFKMGPLEFDFDSKNNHIDFKESLPVKATFTASLSFVDDKGEAMPKDKAVYLGIRYEKGKIAHIHTPAGLEADEDGKAYIEVDGNKYYAKASMETITELKKSVTQKMTTEINTEKVKEKEKANPQADTVKPIVPPLDLSKVTQAGPPMTTNPPNRQVRDRTGPTRQGIDINWKTTDGPVKSPVTEEDSPRLTTDEALLLATKDNNIDAAKDALEAGADVNARDKDHDAPGYTPLMYAVGVHGNLKMTELLLNHNADIALLSDDKESALTIAKNAKTSLSKTEDLNEAGKQNLKDRNKIITILEEKQKALDDKQQQTDREKAKEAELTKLLNKEKKKKKNEATSHGNIDPLPQIKGIGKPLADIETKTITDPKIQIANKQLLDASSGADAQKVTNLLKKDGANPNVRDSDGTTPLHNAVRMDRTEVVEALLSNGADINVQGKDGVTPLMQASSQGLDDMVDLLLAKGANVTMQNNFEHTALDIANASEYSNDKVISSLKKAERAIEMKMPIANDIRGKLSKDTIYHESATTPRQSKKQGPSIGGGKGEVRR